ncbi:hypothetical protein SNE40_021905 [Patella caerulea]|uniref:Apple domain-containing protein n=1 Tax=Patella caerulea TaxID=87958 RepID=A0AAN8G531_PATCE
MKGYLFILFSVFSNGIRADFIASVYTQTTVIPEILSCTKTTYNKLIIQQQALSKIDCGRLCSTDPSCRRIMFDKEKGLCTLFLSGADCITHEGVNGKVCFRQVRMVQFTEKKVLSVYTL